jgi:tRNA(His) guanylyltransferase
VNLKDALGERMKSYEQETRTVLPVRSYTVLRLDGRAFHTYLRTAHRPFDYGVISDMQETTRFLSQEISGTVFAYTQSDEISILLQDFATPSTQPWFGGQVQKIVSVSASLASAKINQLRVHPGDQLAAFDARVFTLPTKVEVANYFLWRQKDAIRNAVSMAAQATFSHKELQGVGQEGMLELLEWEYGASFENSFPETARRGSVVAQVERVQEVTWLDKRTGKTMQGSALRKVWEASAAPVFSATEGWLPDVIPELP